jgi:hypothetical protein
MTSEGQPDHKPTSAAAAQDASETAGESGTRTGVVAPAPTKVRATASVPGIRAEPGEHAAPGSPTAAAPAPPTESGAEPTGPASGDANSSPTHSPAEIPGPYPPPPAVPPPPQGPWAGTHDHPEPHRPTAAAAPWTDLPAPYPPPPATPSTPVPAPAATPVPPSAQPPPEPQAQTTTPPAQPAIAPPTSPAQATTAPPTSPAQASAAPPTSPAQASAAPAKPSSVGIAGSAAVPTANRMTPPAGETPSFQSQPRVYGRPISSSDVDAPLPSRTPPRQRVPGQPVYSDLLGPAPQPDPPTGDRLSGGPAAQASPGQPARHPAQPPNVPAQPSTSPTENPAQQLIFTAPHPGRPSTTSASPPAAPHRPGDEPRPTPAAGPAAPHDVPAGRSGPPVSVIVGIVLVAAALLLLVPFSVVLLLQQVRLEPEPPYAVGDCVVQEGTSAVPADCDDPGAYEVVLKVESIEDCPDHPAQHAITVSEPAAVFCVSPVETTEDVEPRGSR